MKRNINKIGQTADNPFLLLDSDESSDISRNDILTYPKNRPNKVTITFNDLKRLIPGRYLNDNIIDFYCSYLYEQLEEKLKNKMHIFSSLFYQKLSTNIGIEIDNIKNWTKHIKNIFSKDFLIIPINYNLHWSLVIICYPRNSIPEGIQRDKQIEKNKENDPYILHLDSFMGSHHTASVAHNLRDYLSKYLNNHEYYSSLNLPFLFTSDNLPERSINVPQQKNSYDCGVYLLEFVDRFIKSSYFNPNNHSLPPNMKFNVSRMNQLRCELYLLIHKLANIKENNTITYKNFIDKYKSQNNHYSSIRIKSILDVYKINHNLNSINYNNYNYHLSINKNEKIFQLITSYEKIKKIGEVKLIKNFFKNERWVCSECHLFNHYMIDKCRKCNTKKLLYKEKINEEKEDNNSIDNDKNISDKDEGMNVNNIEKRNCKDYNFRILKGEKKRKE